MDETIMAIVIDKRSTAAPTVQEILTRYGEIINLRVGFHDLHQDGNENGQILLHLKGEMKIITQLEQSLQKLNLVKVKTMSLN